MRGPVSATADPVPGTRTRRPAPGSLAVSREKPPDLRHHAGMGDRYRTADGWAVEVVELSATPDGSDGERLKVTYCGFFVALVRTVAELEQWFPLADLQPETLARCHHPPGGLAGFGSLLSAPRGRMLSTPGNRGGHADAGGLGDLAGARRRRAALSELDRRRAAAVTGHRGHDRAAAGDLGARRG
jgi:hypothetical protein